MSRREKGRSGSRARKTEIDSEETAGMGAGVMRGTRDDSKHVAIYLSRESGHYRVKFG